MNIMDVVGLVATVLCAAAWGFVFYFLVKGNVFGAVSQLIALAEATGLTGPEKMSQVVDGLMKLVPVSLRKFISEDKLKVIAQGIFNWMRRYAVEYQKKLEETVEEGDTEGAKQVSKELTITATAELVGEIMNMTLDALKEKAAEFGIDLEGKTTRKEIAEEIVRTVLRKA